MEGAVRGAHKAKEMKRRATQRRAAHKARLAALTIKAETRRGAGRSRKGQDEGWLKRRWEGWAPAREEIAPSLTPQ